MIMWLCWKRVRALVASDYEIIGTVRNGETLVEAARKLNPDLIISDISMPLMTGFEAAAKIKALGLAAKLILLTVQSAPACIKRARSLSAAGYVLKLYTHEQLPAAVAKVLAGNTYLSPQLKSDPWN